MNGLLLTLIKADSVGDKENVDARECEHGKYEYPWTNATTVGIRQTEFIHGARRHIDLWRDRGRCLFVHESARNGGGRRKPREVGSFCERLLNAV